MMKKEVYNTLDKIPPNIIPAPDIPITKKLRIEDCNHKIHPLIEIVVR